MANVPAPDRGRVRVVLDDNYPPYIFRGEDGALEGLLVDLWKLWEARSGVSVELLGMDWMRAQAVMQAGDADIIDTMFRTPAREAIYDFTGGYAEIPVSVWSRVEIGGLTGSEMLRGFLVGAKTGDACVDRLHQSGVTTLETFDSYQKLVDAARADRIKIFCLDDPPANYLLYRAGVHQKFRRAFTLYSGHFHRAVRKGDTATLRLLESGFGAISEKEEQALRDKWLGPPLSLDVWGRYAGYALVVLVGFGGVTGAWVVILRRAVRCRTAELVRERTQLRTLLDTLPDLVWLKDARGVYLACNALVARVFGATEADIVGRTDYDFVPREVADLFRRKDMEVVACGRPNINVEEVVSADGRRRLILETIKTPMLGPDGGLVGVLGIGRDVTQRLDQEQRLRLAARVFESTAEAILIFDDADRVVAVNRAFTEITGYSESEATGRPPQDLLGIARDAGNLVAAHLAAEGGWQGELPGRRRNGEAFFLWLTISTVVDDNGRAAHRVAVFSDITAIKRSREELDFLAHHDPLTGLPNRTRVQERLGDLLDPLALPTSPLAVLFIDLDGFKHINDSLGHPVGDRLLHVAAESMRRRLGDAGMVARLGGDEFVVVLDRIGAVADAAAVAEALNGLFSGPVCVDGRDLYVTASIGVAVYPQDGADGDTLLRHADLAMYLAKDEGRNTYRFYDAGLGEQAARRLALGTALRGAIQRGEMSLVYQPFVRLSDGRVVGVEALLRWEHPELGPVSPVEFIPVAEENGSILEIGNWVLRRACEQAAEWKRVGIRVPRVAVNLSVQQLDHGDLAALVRDLLDELLLEPEDIELEITESMAMRESPWLADTLEEIRRQGVCMVIDDFGTGHSSLARLKQLPVQRLKVDRSFVRDMDTDADDEAIVRAVITLAQSLRLEVLAEGVERPEQAAFLSACGCDLVQGYLFGKPMPAAALAEWLETAFEPMA